MANYRRLFLLIAGVGIFISLLLYFSRPGSSDRVFIDQGEVEGNHTFVTFHLKSRSSPRMGEVIKSGIEVRIKYDVEVTRIYPAWINPTIGTLTVVKKIKYDPISARYTVSSSLTSEKESIEEPLRAADAFFGCRRVDIPLTTEAVSGKRYEILVRARMEELDLADAVRHFPLLASWFEVKTRWAHIKVEAN